MDNFRVTLVWDGHVHVGSSEELVADALITVSLTADGEMSVVLDPAALPLRELLGVASTGSASLSPSYNGELERMMLDASSVVAALADIAYLGKDERSLARLSGFARRVRRQVRVLEPVGLDADDDDGWRPPGDVIGS